MSSNMNKENIDINKPPYLKTNEKFYNPNLSEKDYHKAENNPPIIAEEPLKEYHRQEKIEVDRIRDENFTQIKEEPHERGFFEKIGDFLVEGASKAQEVIGEAFDKTKEFFEGKPSHSEIISENPVEIKKIENLTFDTRNANYAYDKRHEQCEKDDFYRDLPEKNMSRDIIKAHPNINVPKDDKYEYPLTSTFRSYNPDLTPDYFNKQRDDDPSIHKINFRSNLPSDRPNDHITEVQKETNNFTKDMPINKDTHTQQTDLPSFNRNFDEKLNLAKDNYHIDKQNDINQDFNKDRPERLDKIIINNQNSSNYVKTGQDINVNVDFRKEEEKFNTEHNIHIGKEAHVPKHDVNKDFIAEHLSKHKDDNNKDKVILPEKPFGEGQGDPNVAAGQNKPITTL
jgi:hypothetical protein